VVSIEEEKHGSMDMAAVSIEPDKLSIKTAKS